MWAEFTLLPMQDSGDGVQIFGLKRLLFDTTQQGVGAQPCFRPQNDCTQGHVSHNVAYGVLIYMGLNITPTGKTGTLPHIVDKEFLLTVPLFFQPLSGLLQDGLGRISGLLYLVQQF